jgi:hypothetical protein
MHFGDSALRYVSDEPVRIAPFKPKPPAKAKPVPRTNDPRPSCGYLGCERVTFRDQLCRAHYHEIHPQPTKREPGKANKPRPPVAQPRSASKCEIEGCDLPHYGLGWCRAHWKEHRDPTRLCDVDGCEKPHSSRGFCAMHYQRWQRHGDVLASVPCRVETRCTECQVCAKPTTRGRSLCSNHQNAKTRARANADPNRPRCSRSDCDNAARTKGLCEGHYGEDYRKAWEIRMAANPDLPRCAKTGCEKSARTHGLCRSHYQIQHREDRERDPDTPRCIDPGCEKASQTAGRCLRHYKQSR